MKITLVMFCLSMSVYAHHGTEQQIKILSIRISDTPTSSLLTCRAKLHLDNGEVEAARKDLKRALAIDPECSQAKKLLNSFNVK